MVIKDLNYLFNYIRLNHKFFTHVTVSNIGDPCKWYVKLHYSNKVKIFEIFTTVSEIPILMNHINTYVNSLTY